MDPDLVIQKTLTKDDLSIYGRLRVSKAIIMRIEKKMELPVLPNGIDVEIEDNGKSYCVILRKDKTDRYWFGAGWTDFRVAKGLKEGDIIQLYWNDFKFMFTMIESSDAKQADKKGESSSSKVHPAKKPVDKKGESRSSKASPPKKEKGQRSSSKASPAKKPRKTK